MGGVVTTSGHAQWKSPEESDGDRTVRFSSDPDEVRDIPSEPKEVAPVPTRVLVAFFVKLGDIYCIRDVMSVDSLSKSNPKEYAVLWNVVVNTIKSQGLDQSTTVSAEFGVRYHVYGAGTSQRVLVSGQVMYCKHNGDSVLDGRKSQSEVSRRRSTRLVEYEDDTSGGWKPHCLVWIDYSIDEFRPWSYGAHNLRKYEAWSLSLQHSLEMMHQHTEQQRNQLYYVHPIDDDHPVRYGYKL